MSTAGRSWPLDPMRPVISLGEPRLQRLFLQDPMRCASLAEYAMATGIDISQVTMLLAEQLDAGTVSLGAVGGDVFVHTASLGRPTPAHLPQVPPNLWEVLRRQGDEAHAYRLWRLVRELEDAGWSVEAEGNRIPTTLTGEVALVGLRLGAYTAPVVVLPAPDDLAHPAGVLTRFERKGIPLVAVICHRGELDRATTAARRWMFSRPARSPMSVVVLEAPRYQPVLLTPNDSSVTPTSVTREQLGQIIDPDLPGGVDGRFSPA